MALNWNFNTDFIGHMVDKTTGIVYDLYTGNVLCLALYETEEFYVLHWFACDEGHLDNMLKDPGCLNDLRNVKFILNPDANNAKKINTLLKKLRGVSTIELPSVEDAVTRYYNKEDNEQ